MRGSWGARAVPLSAGVTGAPEVPEVPALRIPAEQTIRADHQSRPSEARGQLTRLWIVSRWHEPIRASHGQVRDVPQADPGTKYASPCRETSQLSWAEQAAPLRRRLTILPVSRLRSHVMVRYSCAERAPPLSLPPHSPAPPRLHAFSPRRTRSPRRPARPAAPPSRRTRVHGSNFGPSPR